MDGIVKTKPFMQSKNKIYDNFKVLNIDDQLIFYCNQKKINYYLNKGLAEIVSNDPITIRLNFKTNGDGNFGDDFYLQQRKNECVVCGQSGNLTSHHVIPICYRKHFPSDIKDHSYHDVLPLCVTHHDAYEQKALQLKREIANTYDAPIDGIIVDKESRLDLIKSRSYARTIINYGKSLPQARIDYLHKFINNTYGYEITVEQLPIIANSIIITEVTTHGEMVVSKLTDVNEFVIIWRNHFVESTEPKFLPPFWDTGRNAR